MRIGLASHHMGLLVVLVILGCGRNPEVSPTHSETGGSAQPKVSGKPEELIIGCWKGGPNYLEFRRDGTVRVVDKGVHVRKIGDKEIRSDHREYDGVYQFVQPSVLRLEFSGESPILLGGLGPHSISFPAANFLDRKLTDNLSVGWERVEALPTDVTGDISATLAQLRDVWYPHKTDSPLPGRGWNISIERILEDDSEIQIKAVFFAGQHRGGGHDRFSLKLDGRRVGLMIATKQGDNNLSELKFRVEGQSLFIEQGTCKDSVSGDISLKGEWRRKQK